MLSRPPATVPNSQCSAFGLASYRANMAHLLLLLPRLLCSAHICRYFTTLWDIIYILFFGIPFPRLSLSPSLFGLSLSKYLVMYISLWGSAGQDMPKKTVWKMLILIAGQKEFHVRVPQDRLSRLHIYVRNIWDTSSSLCCATWQLPPTTHRLLLSPRLLLSRILETATEKIHLAAKWLWVYPVTMKNIFKLYLLNLKMYIKG